jgi:PP-loop superfamily ATP-utilizing enzyme
MNIQYADKAVSAVMERVSASMPKGFDGRAVLLFSGGRDSSAVAAAFCKAFPGSELHLLLIDNGLLSRLDNTKRQATLITGMFPQVQVVFEMKRVSQMMREAGMQQIEKDFTERGFSTLLICCACKLIMNYSAASYAGELGINLVMDGFADRQRDYPEQTEEFMTRIRQFYLDKNLVYISPLYDLLTDKGVVNQMLEEFGFRIPKQEPVCMFADSFSTAKSEQIVPYIDKTIELIKRNNVALHC